MKTTTYTLLLLSLLLLSACTQEEKFTKNTGIPLELVITAENLLPADKAQTRITEGGTGGYVTSFSNGDQIGITAVKGGKIVDGMNNIPYTYNGSTWSTASTTGKLFLYDDTDITYIAYYPYSTAMNGKTSVADIVAAFEPKENQSDFTTGYSQSCLMTAIGTANATTKKLSFTFAHAMAMLEMQFKQILNGNPATIVMPNAGSTLTVTSGGKNYTFNVQTADTRYRMMLKPAATFDFNFTYSIGDVSYTHAATTLTMPAAGKYIHYDLKHTQISVTLDTQNYEGALGDIVRVNINGTSYEAVKQSNNTTYKIVIPDNIMPTTVNQMELYINDNLAGSEQLLLTTTNATLNSSTGIITVTLSKGGMEGAGTSATDPYLVTTPPQLRGVGVLGTDNGDAETEYYEQKNNLDLSIYTNWKPVKSGKLYDGKHYKVNNLTSTQGGIFLRNGGTIQNVHLASGIINKNGNDVGGIVNNNDGGRVISNCSNAATVTGTKSVGGIVGSSSGQITHCKNSGTITGEMQEELQGGYLMEVPKQDIAITLVK